MRGAVRIQRLRGEDREQADDLTLRVAATYPLSPVGEKLFAIGQVRSVSLREEVLHLVLGC